MQKEGHHREVVPRTDAELASILKSKIKGAVALVGIGNPIRGDDGFGPTLVEVLKAGAVAASLFDCGTAPENYILPILSSNPDTIILLDAADFGSPPGDIGIFEMSEVSNVGFSTHNSSPRLLADLFTTGDSTLNIFMVVMQPKNTSFGEGVSEEVKSGIERMKRIFAHVLGTAP